jgi:flagellum-specific ATP synthase
MVVMTQSGKPTLAEELLALRGAVARTDPWTHRGRVAGINGLEVSIRGLPGRVGDAVHIDCVDGTRFGEVIAARGDTLSVALYGSVDQIGVGDVARIGDGGRSCVVGPSLLGRVIDGMGEPLDGGPPIVGRSVSLANAVPSPLERRAVDQQLPVGVRTLDVLCPMGVGQRVGLFGGSGTGKSTLFGMMVRGTAAPIRVVALIGERGREVRELVEDEIGDSMANTIVIAATSDQPALVRRRAAELAMRIAEWFADEGNDVLLVLDSLTRLAMAQREIGLAAGEPPTTRGYTPSVFALLPSFLERAGPRVHGAVTAIFTMLVEGDDQNEPLADAVRAILDGHIVLDRRRVHAGIFPAIDPLASLSRLAPRLLDEVQAEAVSRIRAALAAYEEVRDLVEIGAYQRGSNPLADAAMDIRPELDAFLKQTGDDQAPVDDSWRQAVGLASKLPR